VRTGCRGFNSSLKERRAQDVAASRRNILTQEGRFMQSVFVTEVEHGQFFIQPGILRALNHVAVLCQGDFIRRVGRAYRMSATNRPEHAFPRISGTSAGVIRQQGLHSSCGECQNTAPHGARFLTDVGRMSLGQLRDQGNQSRHLGLRQGPKNKSPRPRRDTVRRLVYAQD
jgi:hypothetical protein